MAQSIEKMSNQQIPHSIDTIVSNENTCKPSKHALNKANMLTDKRFSCIQRQFLCCVPVKKIQWEVKSKKNEKIQFFLIQIKVFSDINHRNSSFQNIKLLGSAQQY